jgi:hypothetical protein
MDEEAKVVAKHYHFCFDRSKMKTPGRLAAGSATRTDYSVASYL